MAMNHPRRLLVSQFINNFWKKRTKTDDDYGFDFDYDCDSGYDDDYGCGLIMTRV